MRSAPLPDLAAAVAGVLPDLQPTLLSERAREAVTDIADALPCLTRQFGFECRLAADDDVVDFGLAVSAADGGREALVGRTGDPVLFHAVEREEGWRRLRAFAEAWCDPAAPLHAWSPFVGLEFDAAAAAQWVPVPSVFVALDAPLGGDGFSRPQLEAARQAAALLRDGLSPALADALTACFDALPPGGQVLHVGAMLGRAQEGLRVSLALPATESRDTLSRLGGAAVLPSLHAAQAALPGRFFTMQIDVDLLPAFSPRVGVGLRPAQSERADWAALLAELVALDWASEAKATALLDWIGVGRAVRAGAAGGWETCRRDLSHVKLVCAPGRDVAAKVYFGVTLSPALFRSSHGQRQ